MQNFGLPSNIYNGGAVLFNSTPATQFYLQSMAKKRAKDEALDNYFRNYLSSVNPNGLRPQDINGWYDRFNQLKDFYNRNAQAIKNPSLDRGNAFGQYLGMAKNMEGYAQTSKGAGALSSQYVAPIVTNPDKSTRMTDNDFSMIHAHDLPLDDPQHQLLNPSSFQFDAKDFDIAAQKKLDDLAGKVKMSNVITGTKFDPKTGNKITSFEASYSPQDLQTIGGIYKDAYGNDRSFHAAINDIVHNDQSAYEKYNDIFKSVYGHDMQDNADLAAAYGISRKQQNVTTQKTGSYQRFTPYDSELLAEKLFDYKKDGEQDEVNSTIDKMVEGQKQYAMDAWNSAGVGHLIPADGNTLRSLNAEQIRYQPEGNLFVAEWHDKNGNLIQGTPMTEDTYKGFLGKKDIGSKYFIKKVKSKNPQSETKVTSKTTINNDPLGILK